MKISSFKVEEWMNEYEQYSKFDLANTTVSTLSLDELFELSKTDKTAFLNNLSAKTLGYGFIKGNPELKNGIAKLYKNITSEGIIPTIGAAGANHLLFYSLLEPNDRVVSVLPTYQQLYSIPESFGAEVKTLQLKPENGFLPDIEELKSLVSENTKLICINNPNNPTGAVIGEEMLKKIIEIAKEADAYILSDEVYRGLNPQNEPLCSIADLYEKGISVCSMSKVFSLAGLRLGWIASQSQEVIKTCLKHREYNMISCSTPDEIFAALALKNADKIVERNCKIIRENLEILDSWVQKEKHISYVKPQGGTTALLSFDLDMDSKQFCHGVSEKYGVFLTPGFCFELEKCFRIGYAGKKEVLIEGLEKISKFIAECD